MILYWESSYVPARWKVISGRQVGRMKQAKPGVVGEPTDYALDDTHGVAMR